MNSSDTAWVLICLALVLLMTPGLALFYGGLARSKNAAATVMHSFMSMGIVGVVWVLWGYTLAFGPDVGMVIGDLSYLGLFGVSATAGISWYIKLIHGLRVTGEEEEVGLNEAQHGEAAYRL